ncbi:MAG: hypothetical protein JSV64_00270 [Candidatus Bathyarchaeota archaeon]|nr:MAG: hypothetical protein JSV64_00270 [Candidatus Bathyarchaeota archaeon]
MQNSEEILCRSCFEVKAGKDGLCDHCRYARLSRKVDAKDFPVFYRIFLKIPGLSSIENGSGVFWVFVVPLLLSLFIPLGFVLFVSFSFPINLILTAAIPIVVLAVLIRLSLERFINFWNLMVTKSNLQWDVVKLIEEYSALLEDQKKDKSKGT